MKKNSAFEKFLPKKKNSVIKEEARQVKKKWKKERAEGIEKRKAEVRTQFALQKEQRGTNPNQAPISKPVIIKADNSGIMPLNKFIAHCGITARRDAAQLVKDGKVKVNGEVVTEPGFKVSAKDDVKVAGKKIFLAKNLVYILINKPKDYITTVEDPQGRRTVLDLIRGATPERVFPVGRLDRNTTGVLLLTNDGELTQKLTHPSFEVKKIYEVTLDKPLTKFDFDKILSGMELEDGFIRADALAYSDKNDKTSVGIEIHSGRNRIVRRMFEAMGYDVKNLDRVMFANLTKKNVERGKWRFLNEKEVRLLKFMNSSFIRKNKDEKKTWASVENEVEDPGSDLQEKPAKKTIRSKGKITERQVLERPFPKKDRAVSDRDPRRSFPKKEEGDSMRGERISYSKRESKPFVQGTRSSFSGKESRSFDREPRKPHFNKERPPFERGERKSVPRKDENRLDKKDLKPREEKSFRPATRMDRKPIKLQIAKGPVKRIMKKRANRP